MRAQPLDELIASCKAMARTIVGRQDQPSIVVAPYRFNPLGAHIDHQGGSVLARTLDQYTIICFWPRQDTLCSVCSNLSDDRWQRATFSAGQLDDQYGWDAMAWASVAAFAKDHTLSCGFDAAVFGTLVSGGLSSSASVILGYLSVLTAVNDLSLTQRECVDLVRRVENDYRGLNNGIQDQMSIVYAKESSIPACREISLPDPILINACPNASKRRACFIPRLNIWVKCRSICAPTQPWRLFLMAWGNVPNMFTPRCSVLSRAAPRGVLATWNALVSL